MGTVQVNGRKEGRKEIKWNDVDKRRRVITIQPGGSGVSCRIETSLR